MHARDINVWRVWILDKTIARWVLYLKVKRQITTFSQLGKSSNKLVNLCSNLRVVSASLLLELTYALNSSEKKTFDCLDATLLRLRRDLEVELWDLDCRKF